LIWLECKIVDGKNALTRYNISLLLSLYGLYMTKETFCSDDAVPVEQTGKISEIA